MGKPEADIEKPVCQYAERGGFLVEKIVTGNKAPDRMFIKHGFVGFIEFKAPNKTGGGFEAQLRYGRKLLRYGVDFRVIDDVELGYRVIDEWDRLIQYRTQLIWHQLKTRFGLESIDVLRTWLRRLRLCGRDRKQG